MALSGKMASGAFWSIVEKGGQQAISFLVFMVLARLVGPEEYGLANICFVYFLLAGIIVWGVVDGIVSLQVEDDERLSSLFWFTQVIGVVLAAFCVGTAGVLANLLEQPKLEAILYTFAVVPLLLSLSAVPNMIVMKAMNFKIYAIRTLVATLVGGGVGLWLAFKGFGAYAIVWQQIAFYVVMNLIIWPFANWRPRLKFSRTSLVDAVKPGLNAIKVSSLAYFEQQFPRLVIADVIGAGALGHYAFVMRIRLALQEMLITAPLVVLYPGMSKMKGNRPDQARIAGKALLLACSFLFPLLAILAATAPLYIPFVFGERWEPSIVLLQIYAIGAAALPFNFVVKELFRANNRLNIFFRYNMLVTLLSLATLFLLPLQDGLRLMALSVTTIAFAAIPLYVHCVRRCLDIGLWSEVARIWPFAVASVLTFVAIVAAESGALHTVNLASIPLQLVLFGGLGAAIFVGCALLLGKTQAVEVITLLRSARARPSAP
ncbi:oligosaccharide flippase family protein [Propionivibrio soli]|uniref:oligosaccharide flippase family protein n=1 Tax=Propionivibrio soli TaxID=2976531 RepID=UPI0021E8658C|nr:oligosaccharide flippase family protein [Propionivibrio soli]